MIATLQAKEAWLVAREQERRDLRGGGQGRRRGRPRFRRKGARVFLAGRTLATLDKVAEEITAAGGVAEAAQVDALEERAIEEHADAVAEEAGSIDVSFNAVSIRDVQLSNFRKNPNRFPSHPWGTG